MAVGSGELVSKWAETSIVSLCDTVILLVGLNETLGSGRMELEKFSEIRQGLMDGSIKLNRSLTLDAAVPLDFDFAKWEDQNRRPDIVRKGPRRFDLANQNCFRIVSEDCIAFIIELRSFINIDMSRYQGESGKRFIIFFQKLNVWAQSLIGSAYQILGYWSKSLVSDTVRTRLLSPAGKKDLTEKEAFKRVSEAISELLKEPNCKLHQMTFNKFFSTKIPYKFKRIHGNDAGLPASKNTLKEYVVRHSLIHGWDPTKFKSGFDWKNYRGLIQKYVPEREQELIG